MCLIPAVAKNHETPPVSVLSAAVARKDENLHIPASDRVLISAVAKNDRADKHLEHGPANTLSMDQQVKRCNWKRARTDYSSKICNDCQMVCENIQQHKDTKVYVQRQVIKQIMGMNFLLGICQGVCSGYKANHGRELFVGNLPSSANKESIVLFFNKSMATMGAALTLILWHMCVIVIRRIAHFGLEWGLL